MSRFVDLVRPYLLRWVQSGTSTVLAFQKLCGVVPLNPPLPSPLNAKLADYITQSDQEGNESEEDESVLTKSVTKRATRRSVAPTTTTTKTSNRTTTTPSAAQRVYGRPTNHLLHAIFLYGTASGHELFYIIVLPFLYWLLDGVIARRGAVIWVTAYYLGQYLKDLLRLPRPPSPPVLRMSAIYEAEYGMPSTHAMGAISIVYGLVISHYQSGFDFDVYKWTLLATIHVTIVCLSRLYMGAHTIADIVGGVVLGMMTLIPFIIWGQEVDYWLATSGLVPIVVPLLAVFFLYVYPKPAAWSESYGDTATIIGVASGSLLGIWTLGVPPLQVITQVRPIVVRLDIMGFMIQCGLGFVIVFLTRAMCKGLLLSILPRYLLPPRSKSHLYPSINFENVYRNYIIEIPIKLVTYSAIGFNACFTSRFLCDQVLIALAT